MKFVQVKLLNGKQCWINPDCIECIHGGDGFCTSIHTASGAEILPLDLTPEQAVALISEALDLEDA